MGQVNFELSKLEDIMDETQLLRVIVIIINEF